MKQKIHAARIKAEWGERCPDHDPECPVCQAWLAYDTQKGLTFKPYIVVNHRDQSAVGPFNTEDEAREYVRTDHDQDAMEIFPFYPPAETEQ